jgi:phage FluMu protein gp41
MIRSKIQKYEMLTRVAEFATKNASLFPKQTAGAELVKELQSAARELSEIKASQSAAKEQMRTSGNRRLEKLDDLRSRLEAIHYTAEALELEGFSFTETAAVSTLFDLARNYGEAAGPLKTQFIRHGLPSDFIENLKSAAEGLQSAIAEQVDARGRRKAAIQEFDKTLHEGLHCLDRFEALLKNTMSGNPSVMASWEVARRVERPRSSRKVAASPVTSPAPTPQAHLASVA